jgi:hypothetical protein
MSWLDMYNRGPTVVSGGRREDMNRFLDHYHCEGEE